MHFVATGAVGTLNNKTTHMVEMDRLHGQKKKKKKNTGRGIKGREGGVGGSVERACLCQKMRQAMR